VTPILQAREKRFESISDFVRRTGLSKAALSVLANADAFGSIHVGRRSALWEALALHAELPLFQEIDAEEADPKLAAMQLAEHVSEDYRTAGLSLKAHPIGLVREELSRRRIVTCAQLSSIKNGAYVRVAGIVLVRQRPETASGVIFMTIEDETGNANSIIWPKIFEKYHRVARTASTIVIEGHLQREGEVIHVVAKKFVDVTELLNVQSQSRDFR
jgi:error-prone DNA polymerase